MHGPLLPREKLVESLELLIAPGDRIVLEGDNQKQADLLSRSLVQVDPKKLHDLHLIVSSISRPEHLTLFELGIAVGPFKLKITERHYAPWVRERQEQMDEDVRRAWKVDPSLNRTISVQSEIAPRNQLKTKE